MSNINPCDSAVFRDGVPVMAVDTGPAGGNKIFEVWVQQLAQIAGCPVDWHYSGGRAQVLTLGDGKTVADHARQMFLPYNVDGEPMTVLSWFDGDGGLYRSGVPSADVSLSRRSAAHLLRIVESAGDAHANGEPVTIVEHLGFDDRTALLAILRAALGGGQ